MVLCKTAVTSLLTHWSYCSLALFHHYMVSTHEIGYMVTLLYIVLVMDSYITMSDCQLTMWADDMYSFKLHWPLACRIYFRKYKITFAFSIIFQHWDHTCSWNHDNDQLKLHIVQCVLGSIKLYLHFVSFFNAEITQLVEIIPCGRPRPA